MYKQIKKNPVLSICLGLTAINILVFLQVHSFDFISYDDSDYVYENLYVTNGLTQNNIVWAFTNNVSSNWHPLTWLSLMLDCEIFGKNAGAIHLVNVFFHITSTLLLFIVLKKMTGTIWRSAFVAAAFAIHPMHVESVVWIAERKDVLSGLLFMLTLAAYVKYAEKPCALRYITTVVIYAMGLMAKSMLVTVPFLLLLLDYWPMNRFVSAEFSGKSKKEGKTFKFLITEKIPFFILSATLSVITFLFQRNSGAMADIYFLPLGNRITNAFLSYTIYIWKMILPVNMAIFHPMETSGDVLLRRALPCILLITVISLAVIRFRHNRRYLITGWFWFVGTLVPVIGIVQVGMQAYADRYTYIPYIGLFIIIAWLAEEAVLKLPTMKYGIISIILTALTIFGICAYRQTGYWKTSITLFSHTLEVTKNNYEAYNSLGATYADLGRFQDAEKCYQQTVEIASDYSPGYFNLGNLYRRLGQYEEALKAYEKAISIRPDYAEAYNNLGISLSRLERLQDAAKAYAWAIKINPNYAEAYCNTGNLFLKTGHYREAIEVYKQAISIQPYSAKAHFILGSIYLNVGDKNSAMQEYKILQKLDTELADKLLNLINK